MPFRICWEDRGCCIHYTGHASDADLSAALGALQGDPRYDELAYRIHDFRSCEGFSYDPEAVEVIAAIEGVAARTLRAGSLRVGVVTDLAEVKESAAAYANSGLVAHRVQTFASMPEARAWVLDGLMSPVARASLGGMFPHGGGALKSLALDDGCRC